MKKLVLFWSDTLEFDEGLLFITGKYYLRFINEGRKENERRLAFEYSFTVTVGREQ